MADIKEQITAEALNIVNGSRREAYGSPERNFERIARLWSAHLVNIGRIHHKDPLGPGDVALMIDLMKTARLAESPDHRDSVVDKVGYALCYAECMLPSTLEQTEAEFKLWGAATDEMKASFLRRAEQVQRSMADSLYSKAAE